MLLLFLFALISLVRFNDGQYEMDVKTAACRAGCMDEFGPFESTAGPKIVDYDAICQALAECFMCWEYCELLNKNPEIWTPMCEDAMACFEGCRIACSSFKTDISLNSPIDHWSFPADQLESRSDEFDHSTLLKWAPAIPLGATRPPLPTVIYVLLWFDHRSNVWLQLNQTGNRFYKIFDHSQIWKNNLQVLAVSKSGFIGRVGFLEQTTTIQPAMDGISTEKRSVNLKVVVSSITVLLAFFGLVSCLMARFFISPKLTKKSLNRSNAMKIKRKLFSPSRSLATV